MHPSGRRIRWWNNPGSVGHRNATAAVVLRGRMDNSTDIATLERSKNKGSRTALSAPVSQWMFLKYD